MRFNESSEAPGLDTAPVRWFNLDNAPRYIRDSVAMMHVWKVQIAWMASSIAFFYFLAIVIPIMLRPEIAVTAVAKLLRLVPMYLAYVADRVTAQAITEVDNALQDSFNEVQKLGANVTSTHGAGSTVICGFLALLVRVVGWK